jgi:hypothetical protein
VHGAAAAFACTLLAASVARAADQALDEAWWTGPMLTPSVASLPRSHTLIEPSLFDVIRRSPEGAPGRQRAAGVRR